MGKTIRELSKYKDDYYTPQDIVDKLLQLSNMEDKDDKEDGMIAYGLENAVYQLKAMAQNNMNSDYWRVLYNILLAICNYE